LCGVQRKKTKIIAMPFWKEAPPPEDVLEMEPEELAPFILRYLQKQPIGTINRYNFSLLNDRELFERLGQQKSEDYAKCLMEAWTYLEHEGFVAPQPGQQGEWAFVTRRGQKVVEAQDFEAYRQGRLLSSESLDPILVQKIKQLFIRGDYDTAVFQAFKEVEVRVRKKAKLANTDIGVPLMRKTFKSPDGILVNKNADPGEQVARMELFAGAIGLYKNPSSHREVVFADPKEAADIIHTANQLLRIVESI
jgi:uncharacterized protein (TIGR02391 family)